MEMRGDNTSTVMLVFFSSKGLIRSYRMDTVIYFDILLFQEEIN